MEKEFNVFFDSLFKKDNVSMFTFNAKTLNIDEDPFNSIIRLAEEKGLIDITKEADPKVSLISKAKLKKSLNQLTAKDLL